MRLCNRRFTILVPALIATAISCSAAAQPLAPFSSVTIKNSADSLHHTLSYDGRHFVAKDWSPRTLVMFAYGISNISQIQGSPDWAAGTGYDIDAELQPSGAPAPRVGTVILTLLAERFRLAAHTEERQVSGLALEIAQGGSKLKPSRDQSAGAKGSGVIGMGGTILQGRSVPVSTLALHLQQLTGAPFVVDKTGLVGRYDFTLNGTNPPPPNVNGIAVLDNAPARMGRTFDEQCSRGQVAGGCYADNPVPPLRTALEAELGLTLAPETRRTNIVVIDHIEKPSSQ